MLSVSICVSLLQFHQHLVSSWQMFAEKLASSMQSMEHNHKEGFDAASTLRPV